MAINFKQRDIISIRHFNKEELLYILDLAKRMEQADYEYTQERCLPHCFWAFNKDIELWVAMKRLGGGNRLQSQGLPVAKVNRQWFVKL